MFLFAIGAGTIKELSRIERLSDYFIEYSHKLLNKFHIVKTTSLPYPPPPSPPSAWAEWYPILAKIIFCDPYV